MSDDTLREMLIRMEGKQDVANERLLAVKTNVLALGRKVEEHAAAILVMTTEIKALADHDTRISALENESHTRLGERQGLAMGGRLLWMVMGTVPVGVVIALLRLFTH